MTDLELDPELLIELVRTSAEQLRSSSDEELLALLKRTELGLRVANEYLDALKALLAERDLTGAAPADG